MTSRPMRRGHTRTPETVEPAAPETPKPEAPKKYSGVELHKLVMSKISNGATVADAKGKTVSIHSADDAYVYVYPDNWGNGDKARCKAEPIREFCEEMKWVS